MGRARQRSLRFAKRADPLGCRSWTSGIPREDLGRCKRERESVNFGATRKWRDLMESLLITFIVVIALAVVLQAGILTVMYLAMRKTSAKVESLAEEIKTRVLPTAELAHAMISD